MSTFNFFLPFQTYKKNLYRLTKYQAFIILYTIGLFLESYLPGRIKICFERFTRVSERFRLLKLK